MATATTQKGLQVFTTIIDKTYQIGRKADALPCAGSPRKEAHQAVAQDFKEKAVGKYSSSLVIPHSRSIDDRLCCAVLCYYHNNKFVVHTNRDE